tara:strand:+ start:252 stop:737 length:486 start_codon:yes stop_codon:yes gene_type:complete
MLPEAAAIKTYQVLTTAVLAGAMAASGESEIASLYPDVRAFLIYGCYGALGGAALGMWTAQFRTFLKFMAVLFTGSVVAGFVGPAVASYFNAAVAPLAAFLAALVSPALILDPFGTMHKIFDLFPKIRFGTGTKEAYIETTHITDLVAKDEADDFSGPDSK